MSLGLNFLEILGLDCAFMSPQRLGRKNKPKKKQTTTTKNNAANSLTITIVLHQHL